VCSITKKGTDDYGDPVMKSNYPVIFHFFTVHCEIVASVSYIWLSMMHVKPAQESTDTV